MPPATDTHPDDSTLAGYLGGHLPESARVAVERHLRTCAKCAERLPILDDPKDQLLQLARQSIPYWHATDTIVNRNHTTRPAARDDAPIAQRLQHHPRYDIVHQIGVGGMGTVYKAIHRTMQRPVALKAIHGELVNRADVRDQFLIEIKAAAKLKHPNIVSAYDAECDDEFQLLVMEYVDGESLLELVHQHGPLEPAVALAFIRDAAVGLRHAHRQGMVHRDIKPSNLMLAKLGEPPSSVVKVLDFGLASVRQINDLDNERDVPDFPNRGLSRHDHAMLGTLHYISPEQYENARNADARSDIYSLGCTLYFLLTGSPPRNGYSLLERMRPTDGDGISLRLSALNEFPAHLMSLIERMTATTPADRFQSIDELLAALDEVSVGHRETNPTTTHHRRTLGVALVAFGALAVWGATQVWDHRTRQPNLPGMDADVHALFLLPSKDVWRDDFDPVRNSMHAVGVATHTASGTDVTNWLDAEGRREPLRVELTFDEVQPNFVDVIIISGGDWSGDLQNPAVSRRLKEICSAHLDNHRYLAAICGGQVVLGTLGMLRGISAAKPPPVLIDSELDADWGARWLSNVPVITDGQVMTARDSDDADAFVSELCQVLGIDKPNG
ncbi:MAG: protein kinase [Planctomycetota bacterium]